MCSMDSQMKQDWIAFDFYRAWGTVFWFMVGTRVAQTSKLRSLCKPGEMEALDFLDRLLSE